MGFRTEQLSGTEILDIGVVVDETDLTENYEGGFEVDTLPEDAGREPISPEIVGFEDRLDKANQLARRNSEQESS